jgi:parallel beta-helix repeat protein
MGTGYTRHQDPNYHGHFGYYTTGESHYPNPVYNRFLHGLFPFVTDAWAISAYSMGDMVNDPYNDFDAKYDYIFPFTYPDFLFAYPTWSGELQYSIGGLEGIREGIKDGAYIATLMDLIDDDPNAPVAIDAQDYLDEIQSRISTNYMTGYINKRTDLGYYSEIVEDVSEDGDPNDFEAFSEIRKKIADYIVLLDSGIGYNVHNIEQDTWYTTIQDAIDGTVNGDTLVVYPDTYSGNIDYNNMAITIRSTDPNDWDVVEKTIIASPSSSVLFTSGEGANSALVGCTVDGSIDCNNSSPVIRKCVVKGGIDCVSGSSATIENNKISNSSGVGISISGSAGQIKNNLIYSCNTDGISFTNATAAVDVNNNTIVDNTTTGIKVVSGTAPNITNCILWNNNDELDGCTATYSCIEDCNDANGVGNICGDGNDPMFDAWMTDDGLISYWKLDDESGATAEDSAGNNDGNVVNATWTTGKLEGALDFDGNGDYVSLPSIATLEGNSVTIAAWIKGEDFGTSSTYNPILTQYDSNDDGYYLYTYGDKPSLYLALNGGDLIEATSPDSINTGQWYHIVGTNDGTTLKIYVNGDLKNTETSTGFSGVDYDAYIGYDDLYSSCFDGIIDDVIVYDEALTGFEIEQIYQRGLNGHNDYHIDVNSPCIDAGDPNGTYTGQVDIDFESRVDGNDVDMGGDEYHT